MSVVKRYIDGLKSNQIHDCFNEVKWGFLINCLMTGLIDIYNCQK